MSAALPSTWQDDAPLYAAWRRRVRSDAMPFTIPGHKRRAGSLAPDLGRLLDADVPLYGGLDTVKLADGVLLDAEQRAASLWGADVCRFSTGGSTHANQALCLTLGQPGERVLVARNAHRSVVSGLAIAGLTPTWLPIQSHPATGAPLGLDPDVLRGALEQDPGVVAVLLTDPNYQGVSTDLPAVVDAAHERDLPVVVDQAWGAHLGMAPDYPPHALQCGADAMVTSAHKALPSFSQAALVLARTQRIDPSRLQRAFEATATTSPSGAILASIDAARAFLASEAGRSALADLARLAAEARNGLRSLGLGVPGPQEHPGGRFDPAKLVVHFGTTGHDGLAVEQALLEHGIAVEMADRDTLVAQVGFTDDESTIRALVGGIRAGLAAAPGPARRHAARTPPIPPSRLDPRTAFFADYDTVHRASSAGRISAELVAPYPPGVPLLVPGEVITPATLNALAASLAAGNRIAYAADPSLATLQVVAGA